MPQQQSYSCSNWKAGSDLVSAGRENETASAGCGSISRDRRVGIGCPRLTDRFSPIPVASSPSRSTARASSISCRTCRPRKSAGGKLPPTQKIAQAVVAASSPPALSATPIAPPKRAGNPSNDAAPTARASSPGGRGASGQAPQTVLTAHRLPFTVPATGLYQILAFGAQGRELPQLP